MLIRMMNWNRRKKNQWFWRINETGYKKRELIVCIDRIFMFLFWLKIYIDNVTTNCGSFLAVCHGNFAHNSIKVNVIILNFFKSTRWGFLFLIKGCCLRERVILFGVLIRCKGVDCSQKKISCGASLAIQFKLK